VGAARASVYGDDPQTVKAYDPDHMRMRDSRDDDLVPGTQILRPKPQVPPTPYGGAYQPFALHGTEPEYLSLQMLPTPCQAAR